MLEKELRANWDSVFYPEPEPQVETFGEEVQPVDEPVLLAAGPSGTVSDAGAGMAPGRPVDTIKPFDPTIRQQLADFLQAGFERLGASRNTARKNAQTIMGGGSSNLPIGTGLADIVPFLGTALQTEEAVIAGGEAVEAVKRGDLGEAGVQAGMAAVGMIPGAAGTVRGARTAIKGAQAAGKALAPKAGEMLDAYMQRSGMQANLMAYHGTPHMVDKFDAAKIGTGEGAQSYGYGLYFAESKDVANQYRFSLSDFDMKVDGKPFDNNNPAHRAALEVKQFGGDSARKDLVARYKSQIADLRSRNQKWASELALSKEAELPFIESGKLPKYTEISKGNLYTVDIPDEMVARMIDWDKPLDKQPEVYERIKPLLDPMARAYGTGALATKAGEQLQRLGREMGQEKLSERLRELGIPGIRYLDQGSRGTGEGTRNIVVFPGGENQIKIIKREGQGK